jgi:hypothetical protein
VTTDPFVSAEHALAAGFALGAALDAGLDVVPILDAEGNYTPRFLIDLHDPRVTVVIYVEPPVRDPEGDNTTP